jgi:hypothetical protein
MEFNKVLNGIAKYLSKEVLSNMNSWQSALSRVAVARIINNSGNIHKMLTENAFIKTFGVFDDSGNVDIDGLISDLKTAIREKGYIEFELPLFGTFKFVESDVDKMHSYIRSV